MKLLFVSNMARYSRSVATIARYIQVGRTLGHEVAVFGEKNAELPGIRFALEVKDFDAAVLVIHDVWDFPGMPYLARLLDGMPKQRRVLIDCGGKYNDTIRVEHDFNHLEKMDRHQGWEWLEGIQAFSEKILQPTLAPLRADVRPFLFHGFDPASVVRKYRSAKEAVQAWTSREGLAKPFGLAYVGNNWQRWSQLRRLFEAIRPVRGDLGAMCLAGWEWDKRPDWAVQMGIQGTDVDPALLQQLRVEVKPPVPYDEVPQFLSQARFSPVIHRPLFNHLGLVTNRTFETFCADTIPLLLIPDDLVESVYGPEALSLAQGGDVCGRLHEMMMRPETYWEAVLRTRTYLAERHSFQQRFKELLAVING